MIVGVLLFVSVFAVVALTLLLVFRKDLVGVDLGSSSLLRLYLYIGSLAGIILLVIGLAALIDYAAAQVFGVAAIYGRQGAILDPNAPAGAARQFLDQVTHRSQTDVIRGLTLLLFGALFWGGHQLARARFASAEEATSLLRRAYNVIGMFVFGVATMILLPVGTYVALSYALLTPGENVYVQGFGDSLAGGLVSAPVWLFYLMRVVRSVPHGSNATARVAPAGT
jgi:hypothetical protein